MTEKNTLIPRSQRRYFIDLSRFYKKKQIRVYTGIILSVLTTAFFIIFAIRPTLITIASLFKEIKDKKVIAEKLDDKINSLNSAQANYQQIQKKLPLIDEALPISANPSLFIRQLEALARKEGVKISSVRFDSIALKGEDLSPEPKKDEDPSLGLSFSLSLTGDYKPLNSFLNRLSQLRRLVIVKSFSFQSDEEGLNLNVHAKARYLEPEGGLK